MGSGKNACDSETPWVNRCFFTKRLLQYLCNTQKRFDLPSNPCCLEIMAGQRENQSKSFGAVKLDHLFKICQRCSNEPYNEIYCIYTVLCLLQFGYSIFDSKEVDDFTSVRLCKPWLLSKPQLYY